MMQDQKVTPAQAYEDYFGPAIFEPLTQVLEYAPPQLGERVLDLACGTGIVARRVAPMVGVGGRVVGVDINPGMIEVAQAQPAPEGAPIEWRQGDALTLDLPDSAFDVVLLQQGCSSSPTARRACGRCGGCWRTVDVSCSRSGRGTTAIRCTRHWPMQKCRTSTSSA